MSFEMKYDKDGMPIVQQQQEQPQPVQQEQPVMQMHEYQEQPVEEQPEQEAQEQQDEQQQEPVEQEQPVVKRKPTPAESFAELKKAKLREERERLRLEQEKQELLQRLAQYELNKQQQPEEVEEEIRANDDDLIEGRHYNKVGKKIAQLEKKLAQYEQQTKQITVETRLQQQYPDFKNVVTVENIEALRLQHPEIAQTLSTNQDLYTQAVAAYKMLKQLGIAADPIQQHNQERIERNLSKPKAAASLAPQSGNSPLAKANAFAQGLTPELQAQLRREMEDARKRHY